MPYNSPYHYNSAGPYNLLNNPPGTVVTVPTHNRRSPGLSGAQLESSSYQVMGIGLTDRIFILGHDSHLLLNNPYQVIDVQQAINALGADTTSPLLRSVIEAYYAGARDIYLVAAAPAIEYVANWSDRVGTQMTSNAMVQADPNWRLPQGYDTFTWDNLNYFQRYKIRLQQTYSLLDDWDLPQIIVPLNAPFYKSGGTDFLVDLAAHCATHFNVTGAVCIGLLGSQMTNIVVDGQGQSGWTQSVVAEVKNSIDENYLASLGDGGKFVSVFLGEGTFNFKQFPVSYNASPIVAIAGMLANQTVDQGVTWKHIPNMVSLTGPNLFATDEDTICELGLNPLVRTTLGKRGNFFEVVPATDNTGALNGSDFWSLVQVRLIMKVIEDLRVIGNRYLGSIGYGQAKLDIQNYFLNLMADNLIRSFDLNISKSSSTVDGVTDVMAVDISLTPYFGIREINFIAVVGPGA